MKIIITLNTDSDAFLTNPRELRDVLSKAATKINAHGLHADGRKLLDHNGNEIGTIQVKE